MDISTNLNGESVNIKNILGDVSNTSIIYIDSSNNLVVKTEPIENRSKIIGTDSTANTIVPSKVDRYLRIATFGDSTAAAGDFGSSAVCDIEKQFHGFPVSGYIDMSMAQNTATLMYQIPCVFVANGGIPGNSTYQMLDRSKAAWSVGRKSMQDIAAKNPDIVLFHGASINDLLGFTPSTPQSAIDAVVDRHMQIAKYFTSQGILVLDSGCLGFSMSNPNIDFICETILYVNSRIKTLSKNDDLWVYIDPSGITHDGTGLFIPERTIDGLHLSSLGGYYLGKAEKEKVDERYNLVGRYGDVLWDQQEDYANAVSNNPAKCYLDYDPAKTSIINQVCSNVELTVTISANSPSTVFMSLSSPPLHSLSKIKAGDALRLEVDYDISDINGNFLYGNAAGLRINLLSSNDSFSGPSLIYDRYLGGNTNQRFFRQFSTPVDAKNLGQYNTQIFSGPSYPAGIWVIRFRPWRLSRYSVLNSLPIT